MLTPSQDQVLSMETYTCESPSVNNTKQDPKYSLNRILDAEKTPK